MAGDPVLKLHHHLRLSAWLLRSRSPGKHNSQAETPQNHKRRRLIGRRPATDDGDLSLDDEF